MFGFREYIKSSPEVDFESSRSPAKSESWKKNPVDNAEPWYPHDNIVGIRLRDEWMKSILTVVCRMPDSILWLLFQVCWQTRECRVSQFVPNISIFRQFVSKLEMILRLIQVVPVWIDDHPGKDLKLCKTAPLFCLRIHSISQRIFEHVLPCHKTMQPSLREAFPALVIFQLLQQKCVILTSL